jgi:hypothetical protein
MIDTYGYAPVDGVDERPYVASFNIKMSDGFYASAEITKDLAFSLHKKDGFSTSSLYLPYNSGLALHKELGDRYQELSVEYRQGGV